MSRYRIDDLWIELRFSTVFRLTFLCVFVSLCEEIQPISPRVTIVGTTYSSPGLTRYVYPLARLAPSLSPLTIVMSPVETPFFVTAAIL